MSDSKVQVVPPLALKKKLENFQISISWKYLNNLRDEIEVPKTFIFRFLGAPKSDPDAGIDYIELEINVAKEKMSRWDFLSVLVAKLDDYDLESHDHFSELKWEQPKQGLPICTINC